MIARVATMLALAISALAVSHAAQERPADRVLAEYFRAETEALESRCLADVKSLEDWTSRRDLYRRQLAEMLGLDPMPEKTDLAAAVTGKVDHPEFTVEKVQFQSRPGLYVTGSLYVPKGLEKPAPAILYPCGHGNVKKNGISYGSKASYQHHGAWFARNGYVCLIIDTLQLGEIEGLHHGTYREGMWWWNSRGYTPGGVEAWNCIRSLDYLQSRPEVDKDRLGVTGRSGGGIYTWYVAALDERVKAAVPVAGITDLRNHVIDGVVEGHCDCMFVVNTYRWDYPQLAALVAPRALLIANSDKDRIFPLEGVVRVHEKVRRIYRLHNAADRLGLLITEGDHKDTQELQVPALHWFNRHLKGEDPLVENTAVRLFEPEQLKVWTELPADQKNTAIHESFVPGARPAAPKDAAEWTAMRDGWMQALRDKVFTGWPYEGPDTRPGHAESASVAPEMKPAFSAERHGIRLRAFDFESQKHVPLRLYVAHRAGLEAPELTVLTALDGPGWARWLAGMSAGFASELKGDGEVPPDEKSFRETQSMFRSFPWVTAWVAPRGIGPGAWTGDARKQVQLRRRFMLLGQTVDGMRVWDVRRAVQGLRSLEGLRRVPLWLQGEGDAAPVALYASLFEPHIARLDLWRLPHSHQEGPDFLNVLRYLDVPQAVALAAERSQVKIYQEGAAGWEYPQAVARTLGWDPKRVELRPASGR
jgi:dienelactone hydrolase